MSSTRALVSCSILSLQDSCFVYPCCKGCLSRLNLESKRATCEKCGFTCDSQNLDYRYRLSFKVSRNQDIFGVTVFGGCLNPFFGISANGLQRFIELEKSDGTHTVQQLLVKAVEDCFIGKSVVFGLKVPQSNCKTSSLSGHFVACQIISPCESLMGCTVISYFKTLQQANSSSCHSEPANNDCPSQQKNSQRDELSFDYTPPSCAQPDSQPSSQEFTISSAWQSPGLCLLPGELNNGLTQMSTACDDNILSTRKCRSSNTSQSKHGYCTQDELKDETQNSHRKSFSSSCDMFDSFAHFIGQNDCKVTSPEQHFVRTISEENNDEPHEMSLYRHSNQNISFNLEDAPLSESLQDFVTVEPQTSEIIDTKEHSSCKRGQMIRERNRCSNMDVSVTKQVPLCGENLTSPMGNVKFNSENECLGNPEIRLNNGKIPRILTNSPSGLKRVPFSPKDNRLSFSNKKQLAFKRKLTSSPSVAFCSVNHEKGKYFRHCAQSEVHSVNCKVKQELIVSDDHGDKYNCSVDLFASGQSGMDINLSDMTEISKVNEPKNVNTSEPEVLGPLLFSPCLQSTPVSYFQHSCGPKTRRSRKHVSSLCSKGIKCESTSKISDLRLSDKRPKLDQMPNDGCTESFSYKCDLENAKCNLSANEWSRDLFENSF